MRMLYLKHTRSWAGQARDRSGIHPARNLSWFQELSSCNGLDDVLGNARVKDTQPVTLSQNKFQNSSWITPSPPPDPRTRTMQVGGKLKAQTTRSGMWKLLAWLFILVLDDRQGSVFNNQRLKTVFIRRIANFSSSSPKPLTSATIFLYLLPPR